MTRFFFTFCQFFSKNEEKPCDGNLRMSRPYSTYGSISEAGEFSLKKCSTFFDRRFWCKINIMGGLRLDNFRQFVTASPKFQWFPSFILGKKNIWLLWILIFKTWAILFPKQYLAHFQTSILFLSYYCFHYFFQY